MIADIWTWIWAFVGGAILAFIAILIIAYLTWIERKFAGRAQSRIGPYWVGRPHGWLQPIADVIKIMLKEDIVPEDADKISFNLAPMFVFVPAMMLFAPIPISEGLVLSDLTLGLLYFLAVSSLSAIGIFMAGWGSNSKYAMLSGMRTVAQMISYEVPLVLTLIVPALSYGSFKLSEIVELQKGGWFLTKPFIGQTTFLLFLLAGLAELKKPPFDVPEAESELVAGFSVEYSGMKFAFFYAAEYAHLLAVSALGVVLFLGGWDGPFIPGFLWFFLKTFFLLFLILWIRWSFIRVRIDQIIGFGWKFLFPLSILNLAIAGLIVL
jgi:NADH-quinone oxidoreductase subunit H